MIFNHIPYTLYILTYRYFLICWLYLFDDQIQMVSEFVAQLPELGLPLVLEAELEGLLGDVVVEPLHPGVGPGTGTGSSSPTGT